MTSIGLTLTADVRIRMAPAWACGSGASSREMTSGGPYW